MRIVDGQHVYTEQELEQAYNAEEEMDQIESIKEDVALIIDAGRHILSPSAFADYAAIMEEHFDDAFSKKWSGCYEICRTVNRESIPTCAALRMKMKECKKRRDIESRMREANMAEAVRQGLV